MIFHKKHKKTSYIYMDHAAGTAIGEQVFTKMKPYFIDEFFNPGSLYAEGVSARNILSESRNSIANIISARSQEIIFCDGGTEANNLALRGLVSAWRRDNPDKKPHIISSVIEHASILETCRDMVKNNVVDMTYLSVNEHGIINHKELKESITENTILVSIGYVNGEIGVIQDIRAVAKTIRHYRKHHKTELPYFHTDAVQALNYCPVNVQKLGIDMMTLNGSKIYGPKKIAVLYKKTNIIIDPIITGGSQEFGLRAGTENIPYIVGLSAAISQTVALQESEWERLEKLQIYTQNRLTEKMNHEFVVNGLDSERIPNIINISIPELSSEEIMLRLDAVSIKVSVKSACKSGEEGDSHVIHALRNDNTQSIRFSFGRSTQKKDIDSMVSELVRIVDAMRETFDMYVR